HGVTIVGTKSVSPSAAVATVVNHASVWHMRPSPQYLGTDRLRTRSSLPETQPSGNPRRARPPAESHSAKRKTDCPEAPGLRARGEPHRDAQKNVQPQSSRCCQRAADRKSTRLNSSHV